MTEQPGLGFAALLRQLRTEARLTQEELAEAAGLSPRSVSDLERGINRTARKDTARLLAGALGLTGPVAELFIAAARGRAPAADWLAARAGTAPGVFAAATRVLPRDIASFTGRQTELLRLTEAADGLAVSGGVVAIHAIDGMAGVGKTAFAVRAAHTLAPCFPDGQFFLPLHAHTPGQRPVDAEDALASLLMTAGVAGAQIPSGLEARAARWRDHLAGKKVLLVLDDAAGHEQVRPLLPGTAGSLVLVTSRRRLTALEDAAVITLDTLSPEEGAALLAQLSARPGLDREDAAAGEITRMCGYLPLAIGMLASQLRHHPARTITALAASLAAERDRLAFMRAENLSVAAAFDLSYQDLAPSSQRLFRRLGLVPGPSFTARAVSALDGISLDDARRRLDELYEQHLTDEPSPGRYRLHDLLREHARGLAADDDPSESDAAIERLLDYYLYTAQAAGKHIPTWNTDQGCSPSGRTAPGYMAEHIPDLATPGQAAAWLEAERPNLHCAVDYAAATGRHLHAVQIPAAVGDFLRAHGDWEQAAALHRTALVIARRAGDRAGQASALNQLGILQQMTGDYPAAGASHRQAIAHFTELEDRTSLVHALIQLGLLHSLAGDYPAAAASHQQALALACVLGDRLGQAHALNCQGVLQRLTGEYRTATASHQRALAMFGDVGHRLGQAWALHDLAVVQQETADYPAAFASLQRARVLFRDLGHRLGEANVLGVLGAVQLETGDYTAAADSHQLALAVYRSLGSRVGVAETLNGLGRLASRTSGTRQALDHHTRALGIARGIGMPLEEARALEGIGHCHLLDGDIGEGMACLRQALVIYQALGSPAVRRVQGALSNDSVQQAVGDDGVQEPA